jgi:hypothetical protein
MADSDYHKGEMDISHNRATWEAFMGATKWVSLGVVILAIIAVAAVMSLHS